MTTPKVSTIKRGGSRFYVSPETGEKLPGVTSILDMLPKGYLKYWAAKVVAEEAVADIVALANLVDRNPEGAIDYLKRAPDRNTRKAADTGTDAHDYFERQARGEVIDLSTVPENLQIFVRHYDEFLQVVQPEILFLEETVWSDTHRYAGSFDAFAKIEGESVWVDNKTTRSGVHEEAGLQLSAYRHADYLLRPDGTRVPMPKADGGAVVHVRPEGWKVVPVACGPEQFEVFLHLRKIFDYEKFAKASIVGQPVFSGPEGTIPTGPKRVAPRVRKEASAR